MRCSWGSSTFKEEVKKVIKKLEKSTSNEIPELFQWLAKEG